MGYIRSLAAIAAAIGVLSACTPSAPSAGSPMAFRLDKTCVKTTNVCTVVTSDIAELPPGTTIAYTGIGDGSSHLLNANIVVANASTLGVCDFNYDHTQQPLWAKCKFTTGTGTLSGFHLDADVTVTKPGEPGQLWHWVGTYWFSR